MATTTSSTTAASMRAVECVRCDLEDGSLVLSDERAKPEPAEQQVLVKVVSVAANPVDMKLQRGDFGPHTADRYVLGHDLSGVVEAVGAGVSEFAVGDAVVAFVEGVGRWASNGAYAEYVAVHKHLVARKPEDLSWADACSVILTGLTALQCCKKVPLTAGKSVLVTGASGGVGSLLVQMCRAAVSPEGKVFVTAGSDASVQYCKDVLGVPDECIVNYVGKTVPELVEGVKACNGGQALDVAFDNVGGDCKRLSLNVVGHRGHVVSIVEEPGDEWQSDAIALWQGPASVAFAKNLSLHFQFLGGPALFGEESDLLTYATELRELFDMIADGIVRPLGVEVVGDLTADTILDTHRRLVRGGRGKLVFRVSEEPSA